MNQTANPLRPYTSSCPFDPSAYARLQRANLISVAGVVYGQAIAIQASSLAAFLYDDFCDCCNSYEEIFAITKYLLNAQANGLSKHALFIDICLLYDSIGKPHPEVMWWIAGNDGVVAAFVDAYIAKFAICSSELEQEVFKDET